MFLLFFCLFNDCLDKPLRLMAREIFNGIDSGRVAVINLVNHRDSERRLGVYLATRISNYLFEEAKKNKNIEIRERHWGKKLIPEELRYRGAIPLDSSNKWLEADVLVCGRYALRPNELEIMELKAITAPGATIKSQAKSQKISLSLEDYKWLNTYEEELLPTCISLEELYFLCEKGGDKRLIKAIAVLDKDKKPLNRDSIPVGSYIKLKVELDTLPVYLYIFGWHRGGKPTGEEDIITLLYPNQYDPPNPVTSKIFITPGNDDYAIEAMAPPGYNWVRVIASLNPIPGIMPMPEFKPKDQILQKFNDALKSLDINTWQGIYVDLWITK